MSTFAKFLILALCLTPLTAVHSHGLTEPQHGGIIKVVGDVSMELVNGKDSVAVYILSDEGFDTTGATGKLKVENAQGELEHELVRVDDGGLVAKGVMVPSGSDVLAIITLADGYSKVAGKFNIE